MNCKTNLFRDERTGANENFAGHLLDPRKMKYSRHSHVETKFSPSIVQFEQKIDRISIARLEK